MENGMEKCSQILSRSASILPSVIASVRECYDSLKIVLKDNQDAQRLMSFFFIRSKNKKEKVRIPKARAGFRPFDFRTMRGPNSDTKILETDFSQGLK